MRTVSTIWWILEPLRRSYHHAVNKKAISFTTWRAKIFYSFISTKKKILNNCIATWNHIDVGAVPFHVVFDKMVPRSQVWNFEPGPDTISIDTVSNQAIVTITLLYNFKLSHFVCTIICISVFGTMNIRFSKKLSSFHFQFDYQGHIWGQWKFTKFRLWFVPMIIICCYSSFIIRVDKNVNSLLTVNFSQKFEDAVIYFKVK